MFVFRFRVLKQLSVSQRWHVQNQGAIQHAKIINQHRLDHLGPDGSEAYAVSTLIEAREAKTACEERD